MAFYGSWASTYGTNSRAQAATYSNQGSPQQQQAAVGGALATDYAALAKSAEAERLAQQQREFARQAEVTSGYNQQIDRSRSLGDQGYAQLQGNYDAVLADAAATRERNLARVDQYGNSMRQDLDVQNQQRLAAARQSAIQRGMGNTTIQDSLVRGQNFDNTRQQLTLEDQLLQNRITTDSNLSAAYQGIGQNRAQGLAGQWNQNIANDNQMVNQKLGYLGGIQEDMSAFNSVADIYQSMWQMQNANSQAQLDRAHDKPQLYRPQTNLTLGRPVQW